MIDEVVTDRFNTLGVCVLIPTYNNEGTLAQVISEVLQHAEHIIVINDGSDDNTASILKSFTNIQQISYPDNKGKGWALRQGFAYAIARGYHYAITIDSDGQHFASDLPAFIDKLREAPDAIIIGSRNMDQASIPGKSSFGHKFSNFWFKVETGVDCPDTQSGFRLYPLDRLEGMRFVTRKYEFEIEVLVRAAWKGIKIDSVPVTVYYAPKETRVTHFRPFRDFTRVSVLNTFLVIIAFAWIKPRDFITDLFKKKSLKEIIRQFYDPNDSDEVKACSVALGVFMGIIPIWGFQMIAALFFAALFRLNKIIAAICSHISIPPMIPLVIFLSYKAGKIWMGDKFTEMPFTAKISFKSVHAHIEQYILGSISLAVITAAVLGLLTFILLKVFKKRVVAAL